MYRIVAKAADQAGNRQVHRGKALLNRFPMPPHGQALSRKD
jgi:hypothetical protein